MLAIIGSLLVFTTALHDAYTLPKMFVAAIGVLWLFLAPGPHYWLGQKPRLRYAIWACVGVASAAALASTDVSLNLLGRYHSYHTGVLTLVLCALVFEAAMRRALCLHEVVDGLITAGVFIAIYAVAQQLGRDPLIPWTLPNHRSVSTIGSPPMMGCLLAALVPLALTRRRFLTLFALGCGLVAGGSRAALLGAFAGVFATWAMAALDDLRGDFVPARWQTTVVLASFAICCIAFLAFAQRGIGDTMRLEIWRVAGSIWWDHPILGIGLESFQDAFRSYRAVGWIATTRQFLAVTDHAHNDILHVLAGTGVLGLAAYGWLLWEAARVLLGLPRQPAAGLTGALLAVLVYAKFDPVSFPTLMALALIFGAAMEDAWTEDRTVIFARSSEFVPTLASAALVIVLGLMVAADWNYERGRKIFRANPLRGVDHLRAAMNLNPYEVGYRVSAMENLCSLARNNPGTGLEQQLLHEAFLIARDAAARHPGDSHAADAEAIAAATYAVHTNGANASFFEADLATTRALRMDRYSIQAIEARTHLIAHFNRRELLGEYRRLSGDYVMLLGLTGMARAKALVCAYCGKPWRVHPRPS